MTQATVGTDRRAIAACERAIAPPGRVARLPRPVRAGVSTIVTTGNPCRSASAIARIALR